MKHTREYKKKILFQQVKTEDLFCVLTFESTGDFPEIERMKKLLEGSDFNSFPRLNESLLGAVDEMMRSDITDLMKKIPQEQSIQDKIDTKTSEVEKQ